MSFDIANLTIPQPDEEAKENDFYAEKSLLDFSWGNDMKQFTSLPKARQANGFSFDESSIQAIEPSFSGYSKQSLAHEAESPQRSHALQLSLAIDPIEEEDAYESEENSLETNDRYLYNDPRWKNEKIEVAEESEEAGLKYFETKEYAQAIQALSKSLVIKQNHLGRNNVEIAKLLHKLGFVFDLKGDYDDALKCYAESKEIYKKLSGSESSVAEILQNIGNIYFKQQLPLKAKHYYSKSLELKLERFGEIHREVAASMVNIANVLKIEGKIQDAAVIYQRGSEILLKNSKNDEELANAAVAMNNLGLTLMELNRHEEAVSVFEKCVEVKKGLFGMSSHQVLEVLTNIGNALFKIGDVNRAVLHYQKALEIKEALYADALSNGESNDKLKK